MSHQDQQPQHQEHALEEGSANSLLTSSYKRFIEFTNSFRRHKDTERPFGVIAWAPWAQTLPGRHIYAIPLGGTIGTGLFIGSGHALAIGGPASLLLAYSAVGAIACLTLDSLAELSANYPRQGFIEYCERFMGRTTAFAVGWNYALNWLATLPLELAASKVAFDYWNKQFPNSAWTAIGLSLVGFINLIGGIAFGEFEMVFSMIKITAVLGFLVFSIVQHSNGTEFWHDPGAWNNGVRGLVEPIVIAAFSYSGIELAGLVSNETGSRQRNANVIEVVDSPNEEAQTVQPKSSDTHDVNESVEKVLVDAPASHVASGKCDLRQRSPEVVSDSVELQRLQKEDKRWKTLERQRRTRKRVSTRFKRLIWQTILYYVSSLLMIGLTVRSNDPRLMTGRSPHHRHLSFSSETSPFVIAIRDHGPKVLADMFNGVIVVTTFSVGNSAVFGSSRVLVALAYLNLNLSMFRYIDRRGRALTAIAVALAFGLLAPILLLSQSITLVQVMNGTMMLTGQSSIVTWAFINLAHLRYREAWKKRGVQRISTYRARLGRFGSATALVGCITILVFQFVVAVWPVDKEGMNETDWWFYSYLTVPIVSVLFVGHKLYRWRSSTGSNRRSCCEIMGDWWTQTARIRKPFKFWEWGGGVNKIDLDSNRHADVELEHRVSP